MCLGCRFLPACFALYHSPTAHFVAPPQEHLDPPPSTYLFRWGRDHPRWSRCLRGRRRTHPPLGSLLCPHPPPLWVSEMTSTGLETRALYRLQTIDRFARFFFRDTILQATHLSDTHDCASSKDTREPKAAQLPPPTATICAKKSSSTCLLARRPLRPSRRALPWKTPPP